jgi:hypothetical protein
LIADQRRAKRLKSTSTPCVLGYVPMMECGYVYVYVHEHVHVETLLAHAIH